MVFLAVISWRGGGRVRDPVEAAFHGRSGHSEILGHLSECMGRRKCCRC